ncbi:type II toxin-antitoxin system HicB family antitoxin [Janthinobacterium aestuarii]
MHIPVVIFKDTGSVYGVNVPDIQGVHSWDDSVEDALNNVRTAITSHIETLLELGDPVKIMQSKIVALQANPEHAGEMWALVQLHRETLDSKS